MVRVNQMALITCNYDTRLISLLWTFKNALKDFWVWKDGIYAQTTPNKFSFYSLHKIHKNVWLYIQDFTGSFHSHAVLTDHRHLSSSLHLDWRSLSSLTWNIPTVMGRQYRCGTARLVDWDLLVFLSECHRMTSTSTHTVSVSKISNVGKGTRIKVRVWGCMARGRNGGCSCFIERPKGSIGFTE